VKPRLTGEGRERLFMSPFCLHTFAHRRTTGRAANHYRGLCRCKATGLTIQRQAVVSPAPPAT
jgi:hypothetical protein